MDTSSTPIPLPAPVPDTGAPETAIRELLAHQAQEFIQLAVENVAASPVRTLSVIESYTASMRSVLADLDEAPSPRKQRRGGAATFGPGDDAFEFPAFPAPVPPGAAGDTLGEAGLGGFLGRLESMVGAQTSSQSAGASARVIRDLSEALAALPEDSPLRPQLHDRITQLVGAPTAAPLGATPTVVVETGTLVAGDDVPCDPAVDPLFPPFQPLPGSPDLPPDVNAP